MFLLKLSQEFISSLLHKTGVTQFIGSSVEISKISRSNENSIKNSFQLKYNYQYFFTITGSKFGLEKEGSCIEGTATFVRAEVCIIRFLNSRTVKVFASCRTAVLRLVIFTLTLVQTFEISNLRLSLINSLSFI
jgi:hypothetical protein